MPQLIYARPMPDHPLEVDKNTLYKKYKISGSSG